MPKIKTKFKKCPRCGGNNSKKDGGNERCFHCGSCLYVECAERIREIVKNKKLPSLSLRCDCPARKYKDSKNKSNPCGKLTVIDLSDGEVEINGVFLKRKSVVQLIGFLSKSILPPIK
jgi:hypothetical protein